MRGHENLMSVVSLLSPGPRTTRLITVTGPTCWALVTTSSTTTFTLLVVEMMFVCYDVMISSLVILYQYISAVGRLPRHLHHCYC